MKSQTAARTPAETKSGIYARIRRPRRPPNARENELAWLPSQLLKWAWGVSSRSPGRADGGGADGSADHGERRRHLTPSLHRSPTHLERLS